MRKQPVKQQGARSVRQQSCRRLVWFLISFLVFVPVLVKGDMAIELMGGRRIVVPLDKSEIKSINFKASSAGGSPNPTIEQEPITRGSAIETTPGQRVWQVGPEHALKRPSEASKKAGNGDLVEIAAGTYSDDYAKWSQSDITIRGVGGMAHLKSIGLIPNRKGIWILKGNNVVIENVEFSGAAVKDGNGTGIRHEGGNLTLRNTFFHDNEFSILSGKRPGASIEVISSRFWFQKRKNRFSHGIYIGRARRFTLTGSHFKGTDQGHQIKSRALENYIFYNRIEDVPGGNSSRLIDLPNCGSSFIIGNDLHKAATAENLTAIGYGHEGCEGRAEAQKRLYAINNTLVNDATKGTFVANKGGIEAIVSNNLFYGSGKFLVGEGKSNNNVRARLDERGRGSWDAPPGSTAINGAANLSKVEGVSLTPDLEFAPPIGTQKRPRDGALDVGAREAAR
jgi:hypothetical protein